MKLKLKKLLKPRQNNDLLFLVLMSGGSLSDYHEMRDNPLDSTEDIQPPTEDDILSAWILGKDEEMNQYKCGGHLHENGDILINYNSATKNFPKYNFGLNTNVSTNNGSDLNTGQYSSQGHDYTAGIPYVQQFDKIGGLGYNIAANQNGATNDPYARFILGDNSGGFLQLMMSQKQSLKEGANYIKGMELNFAIGDNASLALQYNTMQPIARSNMNADEIDRWTWFWDPAGIMHDWGIIDYDVSKGQDYLNSIAESVENRNRQNFNTAVDNSNKLGVYNQLSQPYMAACGGKIKHMHDNGGYLNSHYDYITDPLVKINAGGTHQENPNQGVLVSIAPDGQPNLVEEGETIKEFADGGYVFSDRIVADAEILKNHLLNEKWAGKTYADISKELDKIIEEHKTDEISKRTFEEMTKRLQESLEDQKFQEKQKEVEQFIDSLSDEQKEALEEEMVAEAEQEAEVLALEEQATQEQAVQEQVAEQQPTPEEQAAMEEQVAMQAQEMPLQTYSPYDQVMSRALITDAANQGLFGRGGHMAQYGNMVVTGGYNPNYEGALIYPDERSWMERNVFGPINTYFGNLSRRSPEFVCALNTLTPVGLVTDIANGNDVLMSAVVPIGGEEKMISRVFGNVDDVLYTDRMIDEAWKSAQGIKKAESAANATKSAKTTKSVNTFRKSSKAVKPTLNTENIVKSANEVKEATRGQKALAIGIPASMFGTLGIGAYITGNNNNGDDVSKYVYEPVNSSELEQRQLTTNQAYEDSIFREYMKAHKHQYGDYAYMSPGYTRAPFFYDIYKVNTTNNNNIPSLSANQLIQQQFVSQPNDVAPVAYRPVSLDDEMFLQPVVTNSINSGSSSNTKLGSNRKRKDTTKQTIPVEEQEVEVIPENLRDPISVGLFGHPTYETDFFMRYNPSLAKYSFGDWKGIESPVVSDGKGSLFVLGKDGLRDASKLGFDYSASSDTNTENTSESKGLSTWLRYAPAIGSGLQALSDTLGITNKNDYTNPNIFQRSINSIPNVGFTPIGGYRTFRPLDTLTASNMIRSTNEAARRAGINNSSGNASAALAALDAMNQQENNALGNLYIQALQYNNQMEQQIALHNLRINQINASMSMTAQEKNQAIAAEKARLNYNLAQMRQLIENANDMAKSQNYTNLMTNLGNIGRENFIMNQVNSNMSLYYGVDRNGNAYYKSAYNDLSDEEKKVVDDYIKNEGLTIKKK